ncbi:MAG TPA: DUF1697 domain-containing protein [Thermoanaerobaculia bacterium]|nr:DUF1697 domain-containing protein [Thermoanaerobaculia bacterium]
MTTFVGLLRGVNVGGNRMLKMEDLRKIFEKLGYTNVRTVLQSGNIIFDAKVRPRDLDAHVGTSVILRTQAEIAKIIEANPYPQEAEDDPGHLHVVFLSDALPSDEPLRKVATSAEKFVVKGHQIYIHFGDGAGRSKLAASLTEKKLGVVCTARNWNTVRKLA